MLAKKDLLPAAILSFISYSIKLSAFIIVPRYFAEFTSSIFIPSISFSLFFTLVCTPECLIYFVLFWFITNPNFIASCFNFWNVLIRDSHCLLNIKRNGLIAVESFLSYSVIMDVPINYQEFII